MTLDRRKTRRALLAGAGLAAAGLGLTLGWRQHRREPLSEAELAFWNARFDRPEGGELLTRSLAGKPLLLNFWATWCAPCVKELPEIDQFQREFQASGWQVLALAVDAPTPVREFLAKRALGFAVGLAGLTGTELTRTLGNPSGGLPFSVAFDADGRIIWRKLGPTNLAELRQLGGAGA